MLSFRVTKQTNKNVADTTFHKKKWFSNLRFLFPQIKLEDIYKGVRNLDTSTVSQDNDIPTKIIKENPNIFSYFIFQSFNQMIDVLILPTALKSASIVRVFKKG